jgi:hypothetical protein
MNDVSMAKVISVATYTSAAMLAGLALKYHDRALFDEHNPGTPYIKGYPLLGTLPHIIRGTETLHDFVMKEFEELDSLTL